VIDLHIHSNISDGSDTPEQVVDLAAAAGLSALALTDHDRLDGIDRARVRAARHGIELIAGCELSCEHTGTMHVLVYFLEPAEGPLQAELGRLQQARDTRNVRLLERLSAAGVPISLDELEQEAGGSGAGRPHIAAIMVRKGVVGSIKEAFDVWLGKGLPGYLDKERLTPDAALRLARASGGVPVLAHPLSLGLDPPELDRQLSELSEMGLAGLECAYGRYSSEERKSLADLAHSHGLCATGGSDHHGTYKPDLTVGTGRGDLEVPDAVLDELRDRAAR
jgi:predicted metal-dependent phosphoesterase TrpH